MFSVDEELPKEFLQILSVMEERNDESKSCRVRAVKSLYSVEVSFMVRGFPSPYLTSKVWQEILQEASNKSLSLEASEFKEMEKSANKSCFFTKDPFFPKHSRIKDLNH